MKRFVSTLLALCLLCGLPVSAASGGALSLSCREKDGGVRLTLEGLDQQVYALQLELELEGECPNAQFEAADKDVYSPECHVEVSRGNTLVTVYLVADEEPLTGSSLTLGTLKAKYSFRLPRQGELILLNRSLQPIADGKISLTGDSTGSGSSGGSGSGGSGGGGSSGTAAEKKVHIAQSEHGTVTVRPTGAREGEKVTLTISPDAGYVLESITVKDSRGREVSLTKDSQNRYTFSMPASDVEVTARFVAGGEMAFQDVVPGDWCYDAVRYVFEAGLMNGTSATAFTPNSSTTRGQIVAILYRLEGSPSAGQSQFSDVASGAYYAAAVSWASANGIVNGYSDGTFRPGNLITREQMAAFLYRYASYKGRDVSRRADLDDFADAGQIASYAVEPLRWANAAGLINGVTASTLAPGGNATRAQVAVILSRFAQNMDG